MEIEEVFHGILEEAEKEAGKRLGPEGEEEAHEELVQLADKLQPAWESFTTIGTLMDLAGLSVGNIARHAFLAGALAYKRSCETPNVPKEFYDA